jgi:hypothetical protein
VLLISFLDQNNSTLSRKEQEKEFKDLTEDEIIEIQKQHQLFLRSSGMG